jgi:hypothetical protein
MHALCAFLLYIDISAGYRQQKQYMYGLGLREETKACIRHQQIERNVRLPAYTSRSISTTSQQPTNQPTNQHAQRKQGIENFIYYSYR